MVNPFCKLAVAAALICCGKAAFALGISPVLVELTPGKPVATVTIGNNSDASIVYQAESLVWRQIDGRDRYEETDDLVVVPPIAEVAAGGSQIFRVALRRPAAVQAERAYRLVLDNITEEKRPEEAKQSNVLFRISHNLPVFVASAGVPRVQPRMAPCAPPQGKACVRLDNDGNRRIKITGLVVEGGSDVRHDMKVLDIVLAGAWKQWTFDRPAGYAGTLTVHAETSAGPLTVVLPPPPR